jgi:dienelactone hydrolase
MASGVLSRTRRLAALLLGLTAASLGAPSQIAKLINRDWVFQYSPEPDPNLDAARPGFDDRRWQAVAIPHTWSTYETTGDLHPFIRSASERDDSYWWYGWGWYRKRLVIGREYAGRLLALEFDGVQKYSRIYVNGVFAGEHKGGYTSFSVDITTQVKLGETNVIAVQVSNRRDDDFGRIPPMTAGNFNVYGGIYRDVRLVIRDRLSIPFQGSAEYEGGTFVTTPEVSAERGAADVRTWVRNDYPEPRVCHLITTVLDGDGKTVAQSRSREIIPPGTTHEFHQSLGPIPRPRLWAPDHPYLYRVETEVRDGTRLADTYRSPLGFRWYSWNHAEKRLYLNGSKLVLRGINRHQEYPWLGDAIPKWMHLHDLEDIRYNMGLYFQRTAHYPNDPYVYDLSDRLGIITIEELPNIKDITFGREVQHAMLQEAIRRDRNHPSIFIWSMGNETNQPADSAWAHEEDTSRLIYLRRGENGGNFVQLTDQDLPIENLLRCTIRGWYSSDDRDFGPATRNPASPQITGTESWQHETCVRSPKLANDNVVVWLYADHGADRHYTNSPLLHINPKGWTDMYRFPKYVYYLWQANFTSHPMAYILPHYWREPYIGQRKPIIVDSNCDEVTLQVNGETVGTLHPSAANNHSVTFEDVLIRRGTIAVEGRKGTDHITYSLAMAGKPARLVLKSSAPQIPADRSGIAILSADIVDANGVHVYGANPPLTWTVSGPARLAGPSVYQSDTNKKEAVEGSMYIDAPVANVLRSTATPGTIRVKISAPGLQAAEVTITSVAPADDRIAGITEPPVADAGRVRVTRISSFLPVKVGGNLPGGKDAQPGWPLDEQRRRIKATLFVPDPLPSLQTETFGQLEIAPGVLAERLSFATGYGLRVPAILYRPKQLRRVKMPGLIVVNGHGGDKYTWYAFYAGILYARGGAAVLTYDPIGEGERNAERKDGTRQHDRKVDPPEMGRRLSGLMITDVMQAVSYLAQRPDVDAKRLAAMGYSMGSFVLGLTCAVDTRLNACVLVGGGNLDGSGGYWDSSSKTMCQAIPYQSLQFLGDRGAAIYNLHADRGATLIFNGSADDVVAIPKTGGAAFFEDLRRRVVALHGSDRNAFDFGFSPDTGHRPYFLTRPVALWLEKHLDFPDWTAESIAKLPETHISEWAERNHVPIDKLYATEIREGGTRALGTGIPAVPHAVLDTLPPASWEREKDQYIYETWLKKARELSR